MCTPSFICAGFLSARGFRCLARTCLQRFRPHRVTPAPAARTHTMRKRRHRTDNVALLRTAIDCLPVATREAMLDGVRSNPRIIAGAYVDLDGGVCPMLAAHRRGARTAFLSFAKSWDRFTHVSHEARPATAREVGILTRQLEESLHNASG